MGDIPAIARRWRSAFVIVLAVAALVPSVLASAEASAATTWSIVKSPNPTGSTNSQLLGSSCTSSTACTAVGFAGTTNSTLVEKWNGTAWNLVSSPNPSGALSSYLTGVSCATATACTAVGYATVGGIPGNAVTLAEKWNGSTWGLVKSPNPVGSLNSYFFAVSCIGATACTAVGYTAKTGTSSTLVETWNGTAWHIVKSPNPTKATASELTGVSCTAAAACVAVGYSTSAVGTPTTLVEKWNGTAWQIVSSPNPSGASDSYLSGVSCTGATACTAVGYAAVGGTSGGTIATLAERWNGTTWSIEKSPNRVGAFDNYLRGVSCTGATACTAVGQSDKTSAYSTLVETWNGTAWHIVSSPNPSGALISNLAGVSCQSTFCSAAGSTFNGSLYATLVEQT